MYVWASVSLWTVAGFPHRHLVVIQKRSDRESNDQRLLMAFAIRTEKTTKRMRCQILKVGFSRCEKALWN